jgi:hypothetical protein
MNLTKSSNVSYAQETFSAREISISVETVFVEESASGERVNGEQASDVPPVSGSDEQEIWIDVYGVGIDRRGVVASGLQTLDARIQFEVEIGPGRPGRQSPDASEENCSSCEVGPLG